MTNAEAVAGAARELRDAGIPDDEGRRDAVVLARHHLGMDAAQWLVSARAEATDSFRRELAVGIARRARREPLAYITGEREFYGRRFQVAPGVLIPRHETEGIVDEARRVLGGGEHRFGSVRVADLGTGSGCLAITLALELPVERVVAVDASAAALEVARANARTLAPAHHVDFRLASWNAALDLGTRVDVIVSNPPYVPERDRASLAPEVRDFEPASALFAGDEGLDAIRTIVPAAATLLDPGGWLIFEIGAGQDAAVSELIAATPGLSLVRIAPDLQSIPRVVVAVRGGRLET